VLEAAAVADDGAVTWVVVDAAEPAPRPEGTTAFDGGEGCWYDSGHVYFTSKGDDHVRDLDVATQRMSVLYAGDGPLDGVDNVVVSSAGDLYVCEDGGNLEICIISVEREVAPILRIENQRGGGVEEGGTELAGAAFDPSGTRLYFSSQRATLGGLPGPGITYEITGPFRTVRPDAEADAGPGRSGSAPGADARAAGQSRSGQTLPATGLDGRALATGLALLGGAAAAAHAARRAQPTDEG